MSVLRVLVRTARVMTEKYAAGAMMTLKERGAETPERVEEAPDRAVMGASLLKQLAEEEVVVVILTEA